MDRNRRYDVFDELLNLMRDMNDKSITLTKKDVCDGDNFLIFGFGYDSHTITFKKTRSGIWYLFFDNDEPMLLEECPTLFYETLVKNLKKVKHS